MSKFVKRIVALALVAMSLSTFGQGVIVKAIELDTVSEEYQWLPDFTEENRQEQLSASKLTENVNLNKVGLERVKDYNSEDIINNIDVSDIGEEILKEGDPVPFGLNNELENVVLPSSIDNSQTKYFPNIDTQGGLASCASFSTAYYTMTHMVALANDWNVKDENGNNIDSRVLSPKWPYNFVNNGTTGGSFAYQNYNVFKIHGCATMADFPYVGSTSDPKNYREWAADEKVWKEATKYKVDEILRVDFNKEDKTDTFIASNDDSDLDEARKLLLNGYILNFYTWFSNMDYKKVSNDPKTNVDDQFINNQVVYQVNNKGAHEMTIVGYNDDIWTDINGNGVVDQGEKGAFKIANSHGENYANNGFTWLSYDALNRKSAVSGFTNSTIRNGAFLSNEAEYVTVSKKDNTKALLQFKLQHDARNQLKVSLVTEEDGVVYQKSYELLQLSGGAFPVDGVNNGSEITCALDLEVLEKEMNVNLANSKISLKVEDTLNDGKAAIIKSAKVVDFEGRDLSENIVEESIVIDGTSEIISLGNLNISAEATLRAASITSDEYLSQDGTYKITATIPSRNTATKAKLYENNILVETKDIATNVAKQNVEFTISNKANGQYNHKVVLENLLGNTINSNEVLVKVDSTYFELKAPIITVSPEKSEDGKVTVEVTVPALNDAKSLKIYQNGQVIATEALTKGNPNEFKKTIVVDSLVDGIYTFWAEVENDTIGVTSERVRITVEKLPDVVSWQEHVSYNVGDVVMYNNKKYTCTMAHMSLPGWEPSNASALWG